MLAIFQLLRPHQWLKNTFVFAGIIFAHMLWQKAMLLKVIGIAFSFCLLASAIYILNDWHDIKTDAIHPIKKNRPLASGKIKLTTAFGLACILSIISFLLGFWISSRVGQLLLAYLLLNSIYSCWLKKIVVLDALAISAGFLLRILAGTIGIGILPSSWLLICALFLTLYISFGKRYAEQKLLLHSCIPLPMPLSNYSPSVLFILTIASAIGAFLSYAFYVFHQAHILFYNRFLIYTIPLAAYGIFYYSYLLYTKPHIGIDSAQDLVNDAPLLITSVLWIVIFIWSGG
jgi:4-hydroxybenzoate polyprenyltransferase